MEHTIASLEHEHHVGGGKKEIMKVTLILSVLTLVELGLGYSMIGMADGLLKHFIKGVICILMLAKAFYIVGYFMHLKHEVRNLVMTVIVPLFLFVWFIVSFLADGNSYKILKNNYDRHHKDASMQKVEKKPEGHGEKE
ncbi:MAG: cytochrome C oxidase subunit IV family protein [Parafilimonas sp.]